MDTIVTALQVLGAIAVGLLARLTLLLIVVAVLMVPVSIALGLGFGYQALRRRGFGFRRAAAVRWTPRAHYGPGHTWARRVEPGRVRVGVDDVAQRLLAGVQAVDLPAPGTVLRAGEVAGAVTCGDRRAELRSPVSGIVTAVNAALATDPSLVNRDPYAGGWLFAVAPSEAGFEGLRRGESARGWLEGEAARLTRLLERNLAVAAADGGEPIASAAALVSEEQWTALTRRFLAAGA